MPRKKKTEPAELVPPTEVPDLQSFGEDEDEPEREPKIEGKELEPERVEKKVPTEHIETVEQVVQEDSTSTARAVFDWLANLGASEMKVSLVRTRPTMHNGFPCLGACDNFDHPVTLEDVAELHGGGTYQIQVQVPNPKHGKPNMGKQPPWIMAGKRSFTIAGLPKLDNLIGYKEQQQLHGGRPGNGSEASTRALDLAESMVKQAMGDRDRAVDGGGRIDEVVASLTSSNDRRFEILQEQIAAKDARLFELLSRAPDTKKEDRLIDIVGNKDTIHAQHIADQHREFANQLASVRTAHDSEIRQIREFSRNELERYQDRFDRQIETMTRAHDRELAQMQSQHAQSIDTLRLSYDTRIDALNTTIRRGEADLAEARSELAALRAKKEMSPSEQLQGLVAIKQGFDAFMPPPAAEEAEEKSGLVRAVEAIANSDFAKGVASRIMAGGSPGVAPQPPQEQMIPVRRKDGSIVQVPRAVVDRAKAARAAAQAPRAPGEPPLLNAKEVAMAVNLIESAYKNATPPEVLAASARNMVPAAILTYLKAEGVDHFLNKMAQIQDGSPLATVDGRMYVRKVAQFLVKGTTDLDETPVEVQEDASTIDIEAEIGEDSIVPDATAIPE